MVCGGGLGCQCYSGTRIGGCGSRGAADNDYMTIDTPLPKPQTTMINTNREGADYNGGINNLENNILISSTPSLQTIPVMDIVAKTAGYNAGNYLQGDAINVADNAVFIGGELAYDWVGRTYLLPYTSQLVPQERQAETSMAIDILTEILFVGGTFLLADKMGYTNQRFKNAIISTACGAGVDKLYNQLTKK